LNISGTVNNPFPAFEAALGAYVATSKKSLPEIAAAKGGQLIHGNKNGRHGVRFPGLYDILRKEAPARGEIRASRLAALASGEGIRIRPRAKRLAAERKNLSRYQRRNRRRDRANTAAAIEIRIREAGRGYAAIGFLPRAYRTFLRDARTVSSAARASLKGALAASLPAMSLRAERRNKQGRALGKAHLGMTAGGKGVFVRISGFAPVLEQAPQVRAAARTVVGFLTADMRTYLRRKLGTEGLAGLKSNLRGIKQR
jgi:hypothetical protein